MLGKALLKLILYVINNRKCYKLLFMFILNTSPNNNKNNNNNYDDVFIIIFPLLNS